MWGYMNFQDNIKPQFLDNLRRPRYMNFQKNMKTSFLANFRRPGQMKFQNNIKRHFSWISIAGCLVLIDFSTKEVFSYRESFQKLGAQGSLWLPFGLKEEAQKIWNDHVPQRIWNDRVPQRIWNDRVPQKIWNDCVPHSFFTHFQWTVYANFQKK